MNQKKKLILAGLAAIIALTGLGIQLKRLYFPERPPHRSTIRVEGHKMLPGPGMYPPAQEFPKPKKENE